MTKTRLIVLVLVLVAAGVDGRCQTVYHRQRDPAAPGVDPLEGFEL